MTVKFTQTGVSHYLICVKLCQQNFAHTTGFSVPIKLPLQIRGGSPGRAIAEEVEALSSSSQLYKQKVLLQVVYQFNFFSFNRTKLNSL